MLFRRPRILIQIGLLSLVLGNLWSRFVPVGPSLPEGTKDAVMGFFYGVAIAAMLLGIWKGRRTTPA